MPAAKIPVIGILGGVASGKSYISEQLQHKGAAVVSADQLAHEVLKLEEVKRRIHERWGDEVFAGDGEVDRPRMAKIVFAPPPDGPRERKALEELTHPIIGRLAREKIEELRSNGAVKAIVLDVPLLAESGWNKFCDKTIFVDASRDVRQARAVARGWTVEDFERREAVQESLESKRKLADLVIDNSGTQASVQSQVERFWQSLVGK